MSQLDDNIQIQKNMRTLINKQGKQLKQMNKDTTKNEQELQSLRKYIKKL